MAFVDREWENGSSVEIIASRIREGDENDGMPPFAAALSEEEILELSEYLNRNINNLGQYEFEERPDITQVFKSEDLNYTLEVVAEGMEIPWGMAFLPGDRMLITDRNGKMYLLSLEGISLRIPACRQMDTQPSQLPVIGPIINSR